MNKLKGKFKGQPSNCGVVFFYAASFIVAIIFLYFFIKGSYEYAGATLVIGFIVGFGLARIYGHYELWKTDKDSKKGNSF